ncbi:hypothetical protein F5884DRAFT_855580 [Xylogone sp. PMI_703]|nr:hypothetical protein F5884DRAFT_855580 [Xylogone sp. PMI_703]
MASYHRILKVFDRTVQAKSIECDHDINAWDLMINGERWQGKIRLVGYSDVFFIICYSEEDQSITQILHQVRGIQPEDYIIVDEEGKEGGEKNQHYYNFRNKAGNYYEVEGWGHAIKITKGDNIVIRKHMERALKQHNIVELTLDVIRLGLITEADMINKLVTQLVAGTAANDAAKKWLVALNGGAAI